MATLLISEVMPPRVGGSGRWLWEIYRRLPPGEYVLGAGEHPQQEDFDRAHDRRVVRLPLSFPHRGMGSPAALRAQWRALRALGRIVARDRIERVHAGRCLPEGWLALALRRWYRLPYLCYVHGEEVSLTPRGGDTGAMSSRQLRWMTGAVLRGATCAIANSRSTARILAEEWRLRPERIRLLYPGVDTDRFAPAAKDERVRARLGWADRQVVLTVGRLEERKGHDQMIRALRRVRDAVPDVLYAIAGSGERRGFLRDLVSRLGMDGHVQFLGAPPDDDLVSCYQQCDLFVLPNRQVGRDLEGFGIVLLEAQACGRPVVAGASGGTPETLCDPETGRVVPCDDPDELAGVVAELLRDPGRRARMGQAARRWVVERFDGASLSRRAERLFEEVMR